MASLKKEEPLAFMPSSNDALYTPRDIDGYPSPRSSMSKHKPESDFHKHNLLPHESAILSPLSQVRSEDPMASYVRSRSDLPLRASVSSASPLPHENINGLESKPQTNWQELYFDLCAHNEKVVRGLRQHIEMLEFELKNSRSDSGVFHYPWNGENNKSKSETANHSSSDKGRKSSAGNGVNSNSDHVDVNGVSIEKSTTEVPMSGDFEPRRSFTNGNQAGRGVSFGQLQSIPEDANARQDKTSSMNTTHGSVGTDAAWDGEEPPSPPTTAMVPSPPHLRTHAGRTPPEPSMLAGRPTNDVDGQRHSGIDGVDEDPALSEPRIISNASEMEDLDRRLQQVASDPDMHQPQALGAASYMQIIADSESGSGTQTAGGDVEGVVLKRKPSTNFGMAFGLASVPKRG